MAFQSRGLVVLSRFDIYGEICRDLCHCLAKHKDIDRIATRGAARSAVRRSNYFISQRSQLLLFSGENISSIASVAGSFFPSRYEHVLARPYILIGAHVDKYSGARVNILY